MNDSNAESVDVTQNPPEVFDKYRRLVFLPVLISNLYSMYGVLFLNWSVADLFFWFWCEFVLTGITMIVLAIIWSRADKSLHPNLAKLTPFVTLFSFVMVLFYASLFTALAYKGEWKTWDRFSEFLADKRIGLLATAISYALYFVKTLWKPNYGLEESQNIGQQFGRRSVVILGIYAVLMFHYHLTGARRLDLLPTYLKAMGMLLLTFKLIAEFGGFDWFFKRRPKQS